MDVRFRPAGVDDVELIRWTLFTALAWTPERERLVREVTLDHPEIARYHQGWGRRGDLGIVAMADDVVGVCFCRLFTADDHGHGYVDEYTPELAVAVRDDFRGQGLGTQLMIELAGAARDAGFAHLSLSVDTDNPARHLSERLGYDVVSTDQSGVRMVLDLAPTTS
jgi:GNAT superfamily N-acetyltransferase